MSVILATIFCDLRLVAKRHGVLLNQCVEDHVAVAKHVEQSFRFP